ncbi:MAG: ABC transporter substrate-binding protein [Candidatus Methanomethylophilaceae archaeon]|nr:ABC transporter substrate-binding protein [Candidatus Methanomethylophilaceae archaeon]
MNSSKIISIALIAMVVVAGVAIFVTGNDNSGDGVEDAVGNVVKLDGKPERIASTTVTATEYICQLGYRDALVGATLNNGVYDVDEEIIGIDMDLDYPETIEEDINSGKITNVGKATNWSVESVAATNPELVLLGQSAVESDSSKMEQFKSLGIKVFVISDGSEWEDIFYNYSSLGKLLSAEDKANKIINDIKSSEGKLRDSVKGFGDGLKVAHICYCWETYYVYDSSVCIEAAMLFGATNAITSEVNFTAITPETIAEKNPDVIIFDDMTTHLDWEQVISDWKADPVMGSIDCIKNNSFYCLEEAPYRATNYNVAHYLEGEALIATLLFNENLGVEVPNIITDEDWKSYLGWFEELVS